MNWISVGERLPDKIGHYLTFSPGIRRNGGPIHSSTFQMRGFPAKVQFPNGITHWMALPDPPVESSAPPQPELLPFCCEPNCGLTESHEIHHNTQTFNFHLFRAGIAPSEPFDPGVGRSEFEN